MAAGALCMCGHRQGQHSMGYCDRQSCRCYQFEANTEVPVMETPPPAAVPEPVPGSEPTPCDGGFRCDHVLGSPCRPIVEPKPLQTTTQRKTCQCGHREAVHDMDKDFHTCRHPRCACTNYDEIPWTNTETQAKQRRAERGHGGSRTEAEPGSWRALVEDLSTGAIYLVARGSKTFASRSLTSYIDANPLPLTKRGVLSLDHDYVKARDDAPFFNDDVVQK